MADKRYSVYYLSDPVTGRVRYVGCSSRPSARFAFHLEARDDSHRSRWIRGLQAQGLQPKFSLQCVLQTEAEMFRIEVALIALLKLRGEPLTNMTAGGDGIVAASEEIRAKRSKALLGNTRGVGTVHSVEARQQASVSRKQFNAEHPEVVARIAATHLGNKWGVGAVHPEEGRRRTSLALTGRKTGDTLTDAGREAKRVLMTGNASRTGMTNSAESNLRRSENGKKAWALRRLKDQNIGEVQGTGSRDIAEQEPA